MDQIVNPSVMFPPAAVTRGPRQPHSAKDWENHRAAFEQLYSLEHKNLHEVMKIMEQSHGFLATYACFLVGRLHLISCSDSKFIFTFITEH